MDSLILINKNNPLLEKVNQEDLVITKNKTFENEEMIVNRSIEGNIASMFNDASKLGLKLCLSNAYRSINEQEKLYDNGNNPKAAKPGFSEHHTGLAIDVIYEGMTQDDITNNPYIFEDSQEFGWLLNNCYKYGFILRYPKGKEDATGYMYEPWHYRFVGIDAATIIMKSNQILEEYLNKK